MIDNNIEQPEVISTEQVADAKIDVGSDTEVHGSIPNKFKDSDALLQAYNSLQSEFTKKCQALSDLQKNIQDNKEDLPVYMREDWQSKVSEFLEQNEEAKEYSRELSEMIIEDKDIASSDNPLEKAWITYIKRNFRSPSKLASDSDFVDKYIKNNDEIKSSIIKDYINNIDNTKAPALIGKHSGSVAPLSPPKVPVDLTEANIIARAMFK